MSIGVLPPLTTVRHWTVELQQRWVDATAEARLRVQISVLAVATVAAYHYSLESLLQTLGFDTPLAYVGLVPVIAIGLAFALRRPLRAEPPIVDRQLDYIIGLPLLAVAFCINEILPKTQSILFWVRRMDLVSLPFFVAGAVALLFGTRVLWRQKLAIFYLFLAWPWPYTTVLLGSLNGFTNVTVSALTRVLHVVHLGAPVVASNGETGLFSIVHHGHPFDVSVVTACSGVDGMVGFFLVGTAFAAVVRGGRLRKGLWLAAGLVLLWSTNLARLLFIFWAGQQWGEHVAIQVLHPFAGLVIFNIGIVLMLLLMKPFGLHFGVGRAPVTEPGAVVRSPTKVTPIFMAGGLLAITALLLTVNNTGLKSFDLVAGASGDPKLASFLAQPASPAGWLPVFNTEYTQNKSLFGESSRWFRYTYFDHGGGSLSSTVPVTADVINAKGVSSFGAYGVEACYNFHGYQLKDIAQVSLGSGIQGQTLSYATPEGTDWSIVYWIWPVKTGTQTRYERVILYLLNTTSGEVKVPGNVAGIRGLKDALSSTNGTDDRLIVNRAFLVDFARQIIVAQAKVKEPATEIAEIEPPEPPSLNAISPAQTGNGAAEASNGATPTGVGTSLASPARRPLPAYLRQLHQFQQHQQAEVQAGLRP